MILKRCDRGHYYDGEIYRECPDCSGTGQGLKGLAADVSFGDYADEDSVTVALPRGQRTTEQGGMYGVRGRGQADIQNVQNREQADDLLTAALNKKPAAAAGRKHGLKPVTGWLVCIRGNDFGSSFTMKLGKNQIGRSTDMDIVLHGDDSIAMKNHAAVYYVPKHRRFAVEPGASGKRLYLNRDAVLRPVWIKQHDILTIGNCCLMFFPCCGEHFSWEDLIRKHRERNQNP